MRRRTFLSACLGALLLPFAPRAQAAPSCAAISIPFATLSPRRYIRGPRYNIVTQGRLGLDGRIYPFGPATAEMLRCRYP